MRPDNEVWVSLELFRDMFAENPCAVTDPHRVISGPSLDAVIIGVRWMPERTAVAFIYDRPVKEPILQGIAWQRPPWWELLPCEVVQ